MRQDESAFMRTVSDDSDAFRRRQRVLFRAMEDLDLKEYRLKAAWDAFGDLARPSDLKKYKAEAVSIPLTRERYLLPGLDDEPALEDIYYTFVLRDGKWLIANDTDLENIGLYSARHLWDSGDVVRRDARRVSVLYPVCPVASSCAERADRMMALAEDALGRVKRYWPALPGWKVGILMPDSEAELSRMIQATFGLENFVAFAYSSEDPDLEVGFTGHRIMLNPRAFNDIDPGYALTILAHEMLHIVTRESAGPFVPIFMDEGFADHVGYDADPGALSFFEQDVAAGRFEGEIPADFEFTTGSGTDIYRAYQDSQAAIRFFIDRWGLKKFRRFYRSLGAVGFAPGTQRYWIDRSLRKTMGVSFSTFEKSWADSIGRS